MEERLKSIIYLEDRVKKQDREILELKNIFNESRAKIRANLNIIKSLEHTNERLLKTIEIINKNEKRN